MKPEKGDTNPYRPSVGAIPSDGIPLIGKRSKVLPTNGEE